MLPVPPPPTAGKQYHHIDCLRLWHVLFVLSLFPCASSRVSLFSSSPPLRRLLPSLPLFLQCAVKIYLFSPAIKLVSIHLLCSFQLYIHSLPFHPVKSVPFLN